VVSRGARYVGHALNVPHNTTNLCIKDICCRYMPSSSVICWQNSCSRVWYVTKLVVIHADTNDDIPDSHDIGHFQLVLGGIGTTLLVLVIGFIFAVWIGGFFRQEFMPLRNKQPLTASCIVEESESQDRRKTTCLSTHLYSLSVCLQYDLKTLLIFIFSE
jgi:hypothetical protein